MTGWYKRDPRAALDGMRTLTLEERGAYNTILDLIYLRDGSVPDDPLFLAGWLGVFPKTWIRLRTALIEAGKLVAEGGILTNSRATKEVLLRKARSVENKTNGRLGGVASRKHNDIAEANGRQTKTQNEKERESVPTEESEQIDKIIFLDSASQGLPPTAERKAITEFDLVLSDGTIIEHEEFETLNREFGITNSRERAGAAKRNFLKNCPSKFFLDRFRTQLTNQKNRKKVIVPTAAEKQAAVDERDERIRQRDEGVAARERIFAKRRAAGDGT